MQQEKVVPRSGRHVVAVFIAIQIAIPAVMLTARWVAEGSEPVSEYPLSFQMYSSLDPVEYVGTEETGGSIQLDTSSYQLFERDIDYGDYMATRLCSDYPNVVSLVRHSVNGKRPDQEFTC